MQATMAAAAMQGESPGSSPPGITDMFGNDFRLPEDPDADENREDLEQIAEAVGEVSDLMENGLCQMANAVRGGMHMELVEKSAEHRATASFMPSAFQKIPEDDEDSEECADKDSNEEKPHDFRAGNGKPRLMRLATDCQFANSLMHMQDKENDGDLETCPSTKIERNKLEMVKIMAKRGAHRSDESLEHHVVKHGLIPTTWFRRFITVCVMINSIQLGVCLNLEDRAEGYRSTCKYMEVMFAFVFFTEMVVKIGHYRMDYFGLIWNWIDFSLVILSAIDVVVNHMQQTLSCTHCASLLTLRMARILRALRLFRMLQMRRELVVLVEGLCASLRAMCWVAVLLGVLIYASAIFAVSALGPEHDNIGWEYPYFKTLPRAALTLFNISILDEWSAIVRPLFEQYPHAVLFLIFYVFVGAFGVLNLIIGVITESTTKAAFEYERVKELEQRARRMDKIVTLSEVIFKACDNDGSGTMSLKEFRQASEEAFNDLLADVKLPMGFDCDDLYLMVSPALEMSKEDFIIAMARIVFCDQFERDCLFQHSINDLRREFSEIHGKHDKHHNATAEVAKEIAKLRGDLVKENEKFRLHILQEIQQSMAMDRSTQPPAFPSLEVSQHWLQVEEMRKRLAEPVDTRLAGSMHTEDTLESGIADNSDCCALASQCSKVAPVPAASPGLDLLSDLDLGIVSDPDSDQFEHPPLQGAALRKGQRALSGQNTRLPVTSAGIRSINATQSVDLFAVAKARGGAGGRVANGNIAPQAPLSTSIPNGIDAAFSSVQAAVVPNASTLLGPSSSLASTSGARPSNLHRSFRDSVPHSATFSSTSTDANSPHSAPKPLCRLEI